MEITAAERARNRRAYRLIDRAAAAIVQGELALARRMLTRDWAATWGAGAIPRPIAQYHGRVWQSLTRATYATISGGDGASSGDGGNSGAP